MRFPRVVLLVAAVLAGLLGCHRESPQAAARQAGPVSVQVAAVTSRQVQRVVESVGTLFPFDEVVISAEVEGRVDQVHFDLGDTVKEGDVLAHISEEEQRYLLAQNEAQLRQSLEPLGSLPAPCAFRLPALYARSLPDEAARQGLSCSAAICPNVPSPTPRRGPTLAPNPECCLLPSP